MVQNRGIFRRNTRSRKTRNSVHVPPEWMFTLGQNTQHDLRHTAAVHRVLAWYREGKNVQLLLPQLATYLGHAGIRSTQRYLSMTPELLEEANRRFANYALSGDEYE